MALTNRIVANVYGVNGNPLEASSGTPNGRKNYFSNDGNQFYPAPANTSFNNVTCNSVIAVYPTGLQTNPNFYYCVETVAQLVSNGI